MNVLLFLGAGFSREAGLPLQKDFHEFAYSAVDEGYYNIDVYRGVSAAYNIARYIEGKEDVNLEDAFGVLEYNYFTHNDSYRVAYYDNLDDPNSFQPAYNGIPIAEARRNFIDAIELIFGPNDDTSYKNIDLYKFFFEKILEKHKLMIITTNYDLLCKTALDKCKNPKTGESVGYSHFPAEAPFSQSNDFVTVLKLHGSIDWKETSIDTANIVPPTWMKKFDKFGKYNLVWSAAEDAISYSDLILFIGYSMVEIDKGIEYLLKSGFQPRIRGSKPKKIIVLTKRAEVEERYRKLENYGTVKEFEIIPAHFKEFVNTKIDDIL